ncbi:serine hydrolase [Maribacter antarcticus]|uniref:serine hydrolase n=1 Tax=Maribacter antarcticus TaxID=505250 RepID=UPI000478F97D|nr:serine hydrolase [Maribacter antarcticus]
MKIFNTLLLLVFFTQLGCSQEKSSSSSTFKESEIDNLLSFFPKDEPGGTFLIAQKGKILYKKAFGKANLELDIPMKSENVMGIASVTKPFTAMAILKLVEEGKISLEDPLSKFIEDFPNGNTILIKHLVSHTSGLPYFSLHDRGELEKEIKEGDSHSISNHFANKELKFKPGEKYDYSNEAYGLLGYIIEKVTKQKYDEYLNSTFFTPLKMKDTQLESFKKVIKNRATGYDSFNNAPYEIKQQEKDDISHYSFGGLMSSVDDLYTWYKAIINYEILNKSSINKALIPIKFNDGIIGRNGLGWFLGNLNGNPYIIHNGLTWGYGAVVIYFPKEDLFIAHLRNCGYCKYDRNLSYQAPMKMASIILNSEYLNISNNVNIKKFEGIYTSNLSNDKIIIVEKSQLFIKNDGNYTPLSYIKTNTYFSERTNETLIFTNKGLGVLRGTSIFFEKSKNKPKKPLSFFLENELQSITKENLIPLSLNKLKNENYDANESNLNNLGYSLIQKRNLDLAIEIFKLNTELFPKSANSFDSLGEAYFHKEDFNSALKNYQAAIKLHPSSSTSKLMIRKLKENYLKN